LLLVVDLADLTVVVEVVQEVIVHQDLALVHYKGQHKV
jgi:hypothetical protein